MGFNQLTAGNSRPGKQTQLDKTAFILIHKSAQAVSDVFGKTTFQG